MARRATTGIRGRRLKYSDLFTACYSTILATAAVADAKVKDERSREWDRVIAEAKAELKGGDGGSRADLGTPEAETTKSGLGTYSPFTDHAQSSPSKDIDVNDRAWDIKTDGPLTFVSDGEYTPYTPWLSTPGEEFQTSTKFETKLKALDHKIRMSSRYDLTEEVDNEHASGSEWIDEDPDLVMYERDPLSPLHLERRELSCANLIEQLLTRLVGSIQYRMKTLPDLKAHPELQDTVTRIQHLRQRSSKLPNYKWEDVEVIGRERRAFHRSLIGICNAAAPDDIPGLELMVAKICYNLLVFESPITMVTYNVLIQSLDRLEQYDLAQVFVDSFLYDTRLKPNHNSISIFLDHFHQKDDLEGWRATKDRMRAKNVGFDMRIKRRWLGEVGRISIQRWIRSVNPSDLKKQKGAGVWDPARYVSQKAPRDNNAFDALIRSSLSFNGPRNAILHIKRALRDYQDIYSETLCEVMEELLKQRDARGSTSLINCVLSLWEEGTDPDAITFTSAVRRLIYQLLDMIGVDTTLGSQLTPPNLLSLEAVQALLRQMHTMSMFETLGRSAAFIETIESHLKSFWRSQKEIAVFQPYINYLQPPEHWQDQEELYDADTSKHSNMELEQREDDLLSEAADVESEEYKEPLPLGWYAAVEEARANDLVHNKASGTWARLESFEKQLCLQVQRVQGLQDQALPFLLQAMPRYQVLRYMDLTSSNMVYHKKEYRRRQYDELLRVREEGVKGVMNFMAKQLDFRQDKIRKIEADVFSTMHDPKNKRALNIPWEKYEYFGTRLVEHIAANKRKSAALQVRYGDLIEESQSLQAEIEEKDLAGDHHASRLVADRLDVIAKQVWKLEVEIQAEDAHRNNLLRMQKIINFTSSKREIDVLTRSIRQSKKTICDLEIEVARITGYPLPCSTLFMLVQQQRLQTRISYSKIRADLKLLRQQRSASKNEMQRLKMLETHRRRVQAIATISSKLDVRVLLIENITSQVKELVSRPNHVRIKQTPEEYRTNLLEKRRRGASKAQVKRVELTLPNGYDMLSRGGQTSSRIQQHRNWNTLMKKLRIEKISQSSNNRLQAKKVARVESSRKKLQAEKEARLVPQLLSLPPPPPPMRTMPAAVAITAGG